MRGTVCCGLFANPKSGNQGSVARDGVIVGSGTHPGGGSVSPDQSAVEILMTYPYQYQ
ncbi:hypothetical protein ACBJ59_61680 [Nonomuraea sp. MTCD27]|uniref:hypothetical protein n=1 Tax=Nonomuraea sp. MTCD27 TaxID=1676747 RepID=UPI0035C1A8C7